VLVGFSTSDDAGIYKISDDLALVQTVDFFTPIVDDPFDFGRIAAANALSDIYAMGAKPLTALNIAGFPIEEYGPEILTQILEGGAAILREAGVALLGGHTVKDDEPKYGLAVTGTVHPKKIVTNAKARPGDALVLTKPLGTGILASALKKGSIDESQMKTAIASMTTLNAAASLAMLDAGTHAATDVTGFGLLGHAREMARASKVRLRFHASAIPVFELVREMVSIGIAPGGTRTNALEHAAFTDFAPEIDGDTRLILSDAQTSGGLLIALAPRNAERLLRALHATGLEAARIGEVEPGEGIIVET
jgi:selenide, water dikinase